MNERHSLRAKKNKKEYIIPSETSSHLRKYLTNPYTDATRESPGLPPILVTGAAEGSEAEAATLGNLAAAAAVSMYSGTERMDPLTKRLYVTSGGLASLCRWMLSDGVLGGEVGGCAAATTAAGAGVAGSSAVKMWSRVSLPLK